MQKLCAYGGFSDVHVNTRRQALAKPKEEDIVRGWERETREERGSMNEGGWVERWMEGWMVDERYGEKWRSVLHKLIETWSVSKQKPMNITQRSVHFYWTAPICYGYISDISDECNIYKEFFFLFLQKKKSLHILHLYWLK